MALKLLNGCKSKKKFGKTRHVENKDKSEKYVLRGESKVRYHNRILSGKKSSNYVDISRQNIFQLLLKIKKLILMISVIIWKELNLIIILKLKNWYEIGLIREIIWFIIGC